MRLLPKRLDRKLHRIILASDSSVFDTAGKLAKYLGDQKLDEFSYLRDGKLNYTRVSGVRSYITFARDIGLLDESLNCVIAKKNVRSLDPFKQWAGDILMRFNSSLKITPTTLRSSVKQLIEENILPTSERIYHKLNLSNEDISIKGFSRLLTLQSILRPNTLKLHRRWLWLPEDTLKP